MLSRQLPWSHSTRRFASSEDDLLVSVIDADGAGNQPWIPSPSMLAMDHLVAEHNIELAAMAMIRVKRIYNF